MKAWYQASTERSGGRSTRQVRSDGRMQKRGKQARRPSVSRVGCTGIANAMLALARLPGAPLGSAESPQGAELRHGLASAWLNSESGSEMRGRVFASRGPQQHEPPWHFVPHLQWCSWSDELPAAEYDEAATCCAGPIATSSTAANVLRQSSPICLARSSGHTPATLKNASELGRTTLHEPVII